MKRVLSLLLIVCLCCGLVVGCNQKESTSDSEKQETKKMSNQFDENTNCKYIYNDYQFEVPCNWTKSDGEQLYATDEAALFIHSNEINSEIYDAINNYTVSAKAYVEELALSGFENPKIIKSTKTTVLGFNGYKIGMSGKLDNKKYDVVLTIFANTNTIYAFTLYSLADSNKDYTNDFDKIIKSIRRSEDKPIKAQKEEPPKEEIQQTDDIVQEPVLDENSVRTKAEEVVQGYEILSLDILHLTAGGFSVSIQILEDTDGESALSICKDIGSKIAEFNESFDIKVVSTSYQLIAGYDSLGNETIY